MAKHALIVGASAGIGRAVAHKLASMVDKLTLCSRRCPLDLVASIQAENPGLEVVWIVMTAGILSLNGRTETKEGLDVKMSTHYYGR
jgi:short-subunit dehydrogenase